MSNTMKYKGYIGSVEFSEEDGVFYGKVQGIRSLISYEGATEQELEKDFHEAVDEYLVQPAVGKMLRAAEEAAHGNGEYETYEDVLGDSNDKNLSPGLRVMRELSESAERNGISDMTLDEINAEINAARAERRIIRKDSLCSHSLQ